MSALPTLETPSHNDNEFLSFEIFVQQISSFFSTRLWEKRVNKRSEQSVQ